MKMRTLMIRMIAEAISEVSKEWVTTRHDAYDDDDDGQPEARWKWRGS